MSISKEILKKCSQCKIDFLKSNFYRKGTLKDGLRSSCKLFTSQYHYSNTEKRNLREINIREIDVNLKKAHNIKIRTCQALKSQNVEKLKRTFDLLGCSDSFLRNGF